MLYQAKRANFDEVQFFKTYTSAPNIWHTQSAHI